jgi:ADP-heptose:LPS heptosyltransferase
MARSGFKRGEPILLLYTMEMGWSRSWPIHNYTRLAALLSSNYGVRVIAADVPLTNDFTSTIDSSLPDAIKLRSPRAVELVAAVARSSLVVTDDSGIARMARGLGTPAIDLGASARGAGPASHPNDDARDIEAVYRQACLQLQTSRTGALFR